MASFKRIHLSEHERKEQQLFRVLKSSCLLCNSQSKLAVICLLLSHRQSGCVNNSSSWSLDTNSNDVFNDLFFFFFNETANYAPGFPVVCIRIFKDWGNRRTLNLCLPVLLKTFLNTFFCFCLFFVSLECFGWSSLPLLYFSYLSGKKIVTFRHFQKGIITIKKSQDH